MGILFHIADPENSIIWMLLGLVALMFTVTAVCALFLWRRTNAPIPPHIQFIENLTAEPEEC